MVALRDGQAEEQSRDELHSVKRRGLIAGAAALVAAALMKQDSKTVSAANGDTFIVGNTGVSGSQTATATTGLAGTVASNPALRVVNNFPSTAAVDLKADGIQGYGFGAGNSGMFGRNNDLNGVGTWGEAPNGTGAFGDSSSGSGVAGNSASGAGVFGQTATGTGVAGIHSATSGAGQGVYGQTSSPAGFGIIGQNTASGGIGLLGNCQVPPSGAIAFAGSAAPGNFAAYFNGNVVVTGTFAVGGAKSAVVNHPKTNDTRLLYCVESPEAWFEDFGEATTTGGTATVKIDPNFSALVDPANMHVFITEHGGHSGLHTTRKGADGFTVEADAALAVAKGKVASQTNSTFSWRVVAKRSDIKLERFAKFDLPKIKLPISSNDLPKLPTIPKGRPERP